MRLAGFVFLTVWVAHGATRVPDTIKQINGAAAVFDEVNADPDAGIPRELLEKARCIVIVPSLRHAGLILGAKFGKGVATCRDSDIPGGWAGPAFIRIESTSLSLKAGAGETDLIFVIMHERGMDQLMADKFPLSNAGIVAGPVGRSASPTDALAHAEILSYSRAHGSLDGVAVTEGTLRPDEKDNQLYYHPDVTPKEILTGVARPPHTAVVLTATLDKYIPDAKKKHGNRR